MLFIIILYNYQKLQVLTKNKKQIQLLELNGKEDLLLNSIQKSIIKRLSEVFELES